jgi:hypothetical protein
MGLTKIRRFHQKFTILRHASIRKTAAKRRDSESARFLLFASFVLRIDIDKRGSTEVALLLAGNFCAADIPEVARLVEEAHRGGAAVCIELSAVRVIERAAVLFLMKWQARSTAVTGCPAYVREWMLSESRRGGTGR